MVRDLSRALQQPLDALVVPALQSKVQVVLIMQPEAKRRRKGEESAVSTAP